MIKVNTIWISNKCEGDLPAIHACKNPCHARFGKYKGSLPKNHPNYLIIEQERDLALNMVDTYSEPSPVYMNPMMFAAMRFIEKHGEVLVHCNQAESRSPSIALVYLARKGVLPKSNFMTAMESFKQLYPKYSPNAGMYLYLIRNWKILI